jgi:hypothetical protein
LRWADHARSEAHRTAMLNMAEHWMQTAQKLERAAGSVDELKRKRLASMMPRAMRGLIARTSSNLSNATGES